MSDRDPILCPDTIVVTELIVLESDRRVGPIMDVPVLWVRGFEGGIYPEHVKGAPSGPEGLTRYSRSTLFSPRRTRSSTRDSQMESMSLS
jgi:hypothetical protein